MLDGPHSNPNSTPRRAVLGLSWGPFWAVLGLSGEVPEGPGSILGLSWEVRGASGRVPGPSWEGPWAWSRKLSGAPRKPGPSWGRFWGGLGGQVGIIFGSFLLLFSDQFCNRCWDRFGSVLEANLGPKTAPRRLQNGIRNQLKSIRAESQKSSTVVYF